MFLASQYFWSYSGLYWIKHINAKLSMLHITLYFTGRIESDYQKQCIQYAHVHVTFCKTYLIHKVYGLDDFPIT